jgi:hypothetical protein
MSEPLRTVRRKPNRLNRAHAYQSLDPTLTRKGALSHPGSLLTGICALAFFAYVFNLAGLKTYLDRVFGGLDDTARSHNSQVAAWVIKGLPYLGAALAGLVVLLLLLWVGRGAKTLNKKRKLGKREAVSLDAFVEAAHARGISGKVAREAYDLLLPHYNHTMRVTLSDRMTTTLYMSHVDISDLYGNLLRHTDRQRNVGDTGAQIDTVMDLLKAVEEQTPRSLAQSKLYQRAEREAGRIPRKRPSFAERVKHSMVRSIVRPISKAPERRKVDRQLSFIKPARLAVREADLKPRPGAEPTPRNENN